MRVVLDVSCRRLDRAGVTRYTDALADALAARPDVELTTIGDGPYVGLHPGRRLTVLRHDLLWHPVLARRRAHALGADVLHAPSPRAPLARGQPPTVVTVHDLNFLERPETVRAWSARYSRATIRRVLAAADRIVTVSQATADDLARLLGVDGSRVRVVPSGVAPRWRLAPVEPLPAEVSRPYVLFVGTAEPRKNLGRLIDAVRSRRARGAPERLVVAGSAGWGGVLVTEDDAVQPLGRVSDATLHALYAGAACLVLPSLHEGFGLPALEAMAAGCPVVAARAGALPEVCGDAAELVDPLDTDDIARGIDAALARTTELRAAGRARAAARDWSWTAEAMVGVYRELV